LKPNGAAEAESLRALINSLAEPEIRLVTTNGDQATEDWTVEIIHEALIRAWGTLRGWLDEGRKELRLKRQLIDGAQRWYSSGDRTEKRSPQRLYVGTDLEDARQWAADSRGQLPDRVRECLEASEHAEQLRQEAEFRNRAANLVEALRTAATTAVPELLPKLKEVRSWADPFLQQQFDFSAEQSDAKLHAALGLLPQAVAVEYLQRQLLLTSAPQFAVIRDQLQPHADAISQSLWTAVGSPPTNSRAAFQAACALATYATDDQRWSQLAPAVAQELVRQNPMVVNHWVETLRPVRHRLLAPLAALYEDKTLRETERNLAVSIVTDYGADDAELLARLLLFADPPGFEQLLEPARRHQTVIQELLKSELEAAPPEVGASPDDYEAACEAQARRQSRAALALARLGNPEHIWRRLAFHPQPGQPRTQDPSLRTELIHDLPAFGCDLELVSQRLEQETDPSVVRALILTLGEFSIDVCSASARDQLIERLKLQARLRSDPDAGVCGAIEWLLRRWHKWPESGWPPELRVRKAPAIVAESVTTPRNWYINSLGQRMVVLPAGECLMGSPATERGRNAVNEPLHRRRIERPFALAATLITRDDYLEFVREKTMRDPNQGNPYVQTGDSPQTGITWYEAARYCNWLSEREQIASNQWCYLPNSSGEFAAGMKVADNLLDKTGYRLPTEAEWEYACRAGSACSRYFGMTTARLGEYSWFQNNSSERTWPVGIKKPNDAGLFDLLGNAWEWCQERALLYPTDGESTATLLDASAIIDGSGSRVLRGGAFNDQSSNVRAACRVTIQPGFQDDDIGFRPARTYR
jgi:formylglycine-generating enzyme required for sulfatase activity